MFLIVHDSHRALKETIIYWLKIYIRTLVVQEFINNDKTKKKSKMSKIQSGYICCSFSLMLTSI